MSKTDQDAATGANATCTICGAFVTKDFARVFGDNDDEVHGCLECQDRTAIREGGIAGGDAQ